MEVEKKVAKLKPNLLEYVDKFFKEENAADVFQNLRSEAKNFVRKFVFKYKEGKKVN